MKEGNQAVGDSGETGLSIFEKAPDSIAAKSFIDIASKISGITKGCPYKTMQIKKETK